mmetsp:Transcript_109924/g.342696  ORF Transcript_109924/g.342696 Transcript_109924/m.342696 type:complete len:204 (+) Transcript_109924:514-1125(+)
MASASAKYSLMSPERAIFMSPPVGGVFRALTLTFVAVDLRTRWGFRYSHSMNQAHWAPCRRSPSMTSQDSTRKVCEASSKWKAAVAIDFDLPLGCSRSSQTTVWAFQSTCTFIQTMTVSSSDSCRCKSFRSFPSPQIIASVFSSSSSLNSISLTKSMFHGKIGARQWATTSAKNSSKSSYRSLPMGSDMTLFWPGSQMLSTFA